MKQNIINIMIYFITKINNYIKIDKNLYDKKIIRRIAMMRDGDANFLVRRLYALIVVTFVFRP